MLDLFSRYYSRTNRERLIAAGRVILAAFSLLAILVDVSEPSKNAVVAHALLIGYLGYAALVVTLIWRLPTCPRGLSLGTHAIDLGVFFALVYLTEGTTSPFFLLYFVFSIVCATLRWHCYGTAWTGLVAVVGFLAMGVFTQYVLHDPAFDLPHFIIRSVYLILLVVFIAYLGTYRWRLQRELFGLATWPAQFSTE
ncbi:MAG TPA: hypothetical protein VFU31_03020, partial [Candidatus Binatia bacterium]|nr:hypothetical protein [Candidatus Binatia bacterium]